MELHIKKSMDIESQSDQQSKTKPNKIPYYPHYNMHLEENNIPTNIISGTKTYITNILHMLTNMNIFVMLICIIIVLFVLHIVKPVRLIKKKRT